MPSNKSADEYERAIEIMDKYLQRNPDGTLRIDFNAQQLGIDQIIFADLSRSLDITNEKILSGEISKPRFTFS